MRLVLTLMSNKREFVFAHSKNIEGFQQVFLHLKSEKGGTSPLSSVQGQSSRNSSHLILLLCLQEIFHGDRIGMRLAAEGPCRAILGMGSQQQ